MRHGRMSYTALAAAVALACGVANAQDESFEVEDRIEAVEDESAERRDEIAELERADREQSEERAELDEELRRDREDAREELRSEREDVAEEREDVAEEREDDRQEAEEERLEAIAEAEEEQQEAEEERREEIAEAEDDREDAQALAQRREEISQSADEAIEALRQQNDSAANLYEQAFGYAVFDTTKGGLIVTGAGGTGVAREKASGEETYMHLGSAGIGLGAGVENYKLILLFEDEQTYGDFVTGQWDGNISAQAAVGDDGVSAVEQFIEGIRAYRITDVGLMAQVDVSGTRFWRSENLNEEAAADEGRFAGRQDSEDAGAPSERGNPENIDELAQEHDDLGTFFEAVKAAGLADSLTGDTEYTVFAPTNDAFAAMQSDNLLDPENREELVSMLRAHIVADDVDEEMARSIGEASTIDGGSVRLSSEEGQLMVGDARVLDENIQRGNLRVYPIDTVLARDTETNVASLDEPDEDGVNDTEEREVASGENERSLR